MTITNSTKEKYQEFKLRSEPRDVIACVEGTIDYGHQLPNHEGKCQYVHGHTADIKLKVKGPIDETDGMVVDFKHLKDILKKVEDMLDHSYLNDLEDTPTTEVIGSFIYYVINEELKDLPRPVWIHELEISEGRGKSIIL